MKNKRIREALANTGVKYWELAQLLKVSDGTLCRWMRNELPEAEQIRIIGLIRKYAGEKENEHN